MDFSFFLDLLKTMLGFVFGTLVSAIITGLLINRFVVKKIMENKDIQDIIKLIRDTKDEIMKHNENGKTVERYNGKDGTLPEASDYKPS